MGTPLVMEALSRPELTTPTPPRSAFPFQNLQRTRTLPNPAAAHAVQAIQRPATSLIIAALTLVWMYLHRENLTYADVGMSYDLVCHQAQLWRIFSAQVRDMT